MGAEGALDVQGKIRLCFVFMFIILNVSYKWLSRNFSVSSNDAKRLLQEFVTKHGKGLEVIYALSGWLKENPDVYNIRLVSGCKLAVHCFRSLIDAEAKQDLRGKCSVHVYSVQASIPKDPAAIWNTEFVQAEELFDQPLTVDNCLRDNRFCGVSNSFVQRNVNGKSIAMEPPATKLQPDPMSGILSPTAAVAMEGSDDIVSPKVRAVPDNPPLGKVKDDASFFNKKKVANEKTSHGGNGRSLANLWGRASAKSKPEIPKVDATNDISRVSATSDAQISAQEALEPISSDDEWQKASQKESGGSIGRKRRVVLDFSDEEDEANVVNLALPEPSSCQSELCPKKNTDLEGMGFDGQAAEKARILEEKASVGVSGLSSEAEVGRSRKVDIDEAQDLGPEKSSDRNREEQATDYVSTSPKRAKVLKTRIDERGREGCLGGDAAEKGKAATTTAADNTSRDRPPSAAKSSPPAPRHAPSVPAAKAGGGRTTKAGGAKDNKQPNILSFFKKA
ncbi:unnamed protein product [Spirodela intermedia]|uniref:DNA polymerase delta subunit 3 n=1 Tax=Spirodela intermedia TaxID=51605 RepID=A0A7I8IT12_SPIIN|nr:unnamed protein product [Spirodela intermedia]CAA6661143.1 unnamed protein product [Spirodela intermedia]